MRLFLTLSFVLAVLVVAACNGDDEPAAPTLPGGRTPAPTAPGDAGPASKLAATFLAGVEGKYEYEYAGPLGDFSEGLYTLYRLGVNDRHDWTTDKYGFDATTVTILAEQENYICTISPATNTCRVSTLREVEGLRVYFSPVELAMIALATKPDDWEVTELGERISAGVTGACYEATSATRIGEGPPASENVEVCFTDDGAIVHFERTITPDSQSIAPATYTLVLVEASPATASDFEPTGRVQ